MQVFSSRYNSKGILADTRKRMDLLWGIKTMEKKLKITDVNRIVYSLSVEDLQHVANEEYSRELTEEEIQLVEDKLGDCISWYEEIFSAIHDIIPQS